MIRLLLFSALLLSAAVLSPGLSASADEDEALLNTIGKQSFQYFRECVNTGNGLVQDRCPNSGFAGNGYAPATTAGVGFGLAALASGAERGWIDREEAAARALRTLRFFSERMESVHGFYYHFIDMETGRRVWDCELSSIDSALFLAGALTAAAYFGDKEITALANRLYERTDWRWMANGGKHLSMGWKPESGFLPYTWDTYNESLVMYILALGSPTYPLRPESWTAIARPWVTYKGHRFIHCPPLFTHQFSHIFLDFRGKSDGLADYFENSRQATLANRKFCLNNADRYKTYGPDSWGLTASIGPDGYKAYGTLAEHDGTVAPAAALSSVVFTPELSLSAARNWYHNHRARLWGRYGFADSYNLDRNFVAQDAYAINQGPTLLMIENYRSGLVWKSFMSLPQVQRGLRAAGFN
jgi:hypothetical protein